MDKILIVEDNKVVNKALSLFLENNGYEVSSVYNAEDALIEINKKDYTLIILDLNLPKMNGYQFIQVIRKKTDIPVIINTAYANVKSRVKLINVGASDFIEKSFDKEEVLESVRIILEDQRKSKERNRIVTYKDVEINFNKRLVKKAGQEVELTSKEFDILKMIFDNPQRAFSRKQLYLVVWGEEYDEFVDNTINVHVKRLRNKIEDDPKKPEIIETVYAFGYRLGKQVVEELQKEDWE